MSACGALGGDGLWGARGCRIDVWWDVRVGGFVHKERGGGGEAEGGDEGGVICVAENDNLAGERGRFAEYIA